MDENVIDELLDSILSPLASAETQSAALLLLLRETNTVSEQQIAAATEQASNATEIKMRATRLRLKRILTAAISHFEKQHQPKEEPKKPSAPGKQPESAESSKLAGSEKPEQKAEP